MKKVAILQSNYIPWKGYFDIINMVDEFILYDDMQYTKRDWRNRNKIKTVDGLKWLTIPVITKGKFYQRINETKVESHDWVHSHWRSIEYSYGKAEFFNEYKDQIRDVYEKCKNEELLSRINYSFIRCICDILGIKTKISWSSDYTLADGKTERLVALCKDAGADLYLSGPAAKDYIVDEMFEKENIVLQYMDYSNYPEYHQLYGGFEHNVSVLDLIFNEGKNAVKYMKSFKKDVEI